MIVTSTSIMEDLIYELNMDFVASMSPTVAYLVLLMVTGVVGNTLTFVVYYKRFKPSVTRTYILAMSVCDLLSNCLALPSDIYEFRFQYDFDDDAGCKFFGFITRFLALMGAVLLVAIAVDRWRKICRSTGKPRTVKHVYIELPCLVVFAACYAIPFGVLRGLQTVPLENVNATGNTTGSTCSIDDTYVGSLLFVIYNASMGLSFIISVTIMSVCYALIGRHLWLHKKRLLKNSKGRQNQRSGHDSRHSHQEAREISEDERRNDSTGAFTAGGSENNVEYKASTEKLVISITEDSGHCSSTSDTENTTRFCLQSSSTGTPTLANISEMKTSNQQEPESCPGEASVDDITPSKSGTTVEQGPYTLTVRKAREVPMVANAFQSRTHPSKTASKPLKAKKHPTSRKQSATKPKQKLPTRTTLMMFILTAMFVLSYLPYLTMAAMYRGKKIEGASFWVKNLHQIALRSFFINSAVNPLVYSFCSVMFRRECYLFLCRK